MTDFYTNVVVDGNNILYRGVSQGKRVQRKIPYKPRLYLRSDKEQALWNTLRGEPLEEKIFNNIFEARTFIKKYRDVEGFEIFGNQKFLYSFLADMFPDLVEVDTTQVKVAFLDIEVDTSNGNPDIKKAEAFVTAITMSIGEREYSFGLGPWDPKDNNVVYKQFEDEADLLMAFLDAWADEAPDIVSGWNIEGFDIPYLVNRITMVLGYEEMSRLSPWKKVESRTIHDKFGKDQIVWDIFGISIIDYIPLYKKYAPKPNQENYRLETIARVELDEGEGKLDYKTQGYKDLHDLRTRNHGLYMDYNRADVSSIKKIDDKLHLIDLVITLATRNHVNYQDVFFQVKMWDSIVHSKLQSRHQVLPPDVHHGREELPGAFVKEPIQGRVENVVSFDLTSLYPHLIMMYNISPETLVYPEEYDDEMRMFKRMNVVNVDSLVQRKLQLDFLKKRNLTLAPNGQFYRTDKKGFMPQLMEDMFEARSTYKKKQLQAEKDMSIIQNELRRRGIVDTK